MRVIWGVATLALLAACQSAPPLPPPPPYTAADFQLDGADPASPEAQRILARGNNAMGVEMYLDIVAQQQVQKKPDNVFISPASISTAFGLLYAGANGSTAEEVARVMHFSHPDTNFHAAMGAFADGLESATEGEVLSINNAVWLDKGTVVEEGYFPRVAPYGAGEHRVDYRNDPDTARKKINTWVEQKTHGRIKDLLSPPHVTRDSRSILVNTIYMKMSWADAFEAEWTKDELFHLASGKDVLTPMMRQVEWLRYFDGPGFRMAALQYQRGEYKSTPGVSMVIMLPDDRQGLAKLEAEMTPAVLEGWLGELAKESARLDLKFPKLKIEDKFELKGTLQRLGMTETFSDGADLTRLAKGERQPDGGALKVGAVVHQTFIEVDEKGTEAAAATAIATVVVTSGGGPPPPPPIPFVVDHPFLFLIRDDVTGAILFMGRVIDPGTSAG
jgi:serine protease inhibitor